MTCEEAVERLPDDAADVADHLAGCPTCRELDEDYRRDGELLAAGLRAMAERPRRRGAPWRLLPVAAAGALFLGILSLLFRPTPDGTPAGLPEPALPEPLLASDEPLFGTVIAWDPAQNVVAVSAGADDRVALDQVLTLYRRGGAAETEVGTLVIERVEAGWSSGRLRDRRADPRTGDFFVSERLLTAEERVRVLDYLFTCRPVPAGEIRALVARLGSDPRAAAALRDLGAPVRVFLETGGAGLADQVRVREAIAETDDLDRRVRLSGLDHDVDLLSRLRDPRAAARLRSILAAAAPPPAPRLHDWWAASKDAFRWNPVLDRFERN
jgi:hypothetical protein